MNKPRLFVDMDGVLAEWKTIDIPSQIPTIKMQQIVNDTLHTPNYFYDLKPHDNTVQAIRQIIEEGTADVYIVSCFLPDTPCYPASHPLVDKNRWLDKYFGEILIPQNKRLFVPDGEPKASTIELFYDIKLGAEDILLDDYTKNLMDWEKHGSLGLKYMNGINGTKGTWNGPVLNGKDINAQQIKENLISYLQNIKEFADIEPELE